MTPIYRRALIVGAGPGLSASLARLLAGEGMRVGLASRNPDKLADLARETGAATHACDASRPEEVEALFAAMGTALGGAPDVVVYNASGRLRGPLVELDPEKTERALAIGAYGGFLVGQAAARRMLPEGHGAILFTGASASLKGFAGSAAFAMGIHGAHVVIDGGIRSAARPEPADQPDSLLDPDAIARSYLGLLRQDRSCWSAEIEVRPWVERY